MRVRATVVYEWSVKLSHFGNDATPDYVVECIKKLIDEGDLLPEEVADVVVSTKIEEVK